MLVLKKNRFISSVGVSLMVAAFVSCASNVKKADIPSTANPQEEIAKLDADINVAVSKNIDVLAQSDFSQVMKWQDEAKSDLASKQKQEEILDDVRKARGYLNNAFATAENRESKAAGLFEARQAALKAGAGQHSELRSEWKDVDSDVSGKADHFENVSVEALSKLQERYVNLERKAIVITQLSHAQSILTGVKKDGAAKKAPVTFKKTELSMKNAESVISTNSRNPKGFEAAVNQANADADLLMEVMTTIRQNGKSLPEAAAIKIVNQDRQIKNLKTTADANAAAEELLLKKNQQLASDLDSKGQDLNSMQKDLSVTKENLNATKENLNATNQDLNATKENLNATNQNLNSAKASVEVQRALEKARSQFTAEEADAYQQGRNLVIRLKKVNFASGHAELPGSSLPMLAKVSEVAKSLNATEIKVEGHTDSTGNANQNKTISEQRANAVATYFKSNGFDKIDVQASGFGFDKPIATNKSKEGRAQNRRVDIVITPESATTQ